MGDNTGSDNAPGSGLSLCTGVLVRIRQVKILELCSRKTSMVRFGDTDTVTDSQSQCQCHSVSVT